MVLSLRLGNSIVSYLKPPSHDSGGSRLEGLPGLFLASSWPLPGLAGFLLAKSSFGGSKLRFRGF